MTVFKKVNMQLFLLLSLVFASSFGESVSFNNMPTSFGPLNGRRIEICLQNSPIGTLDYLKVPILPLFLIHFYSTVVETTMNFNIIFIIRRFCEDLVGALARLPI